MDGTSGCDEKTVQCGGSSSVGVSGQIRIVESREELGSQGMGIMVGGEGDDDYRFSSMMWADDPFRRNGKGTQGTGRTLKKRNGLLVAGQAHLSSEECVFEDQMWQGGTSRF